MTAEILRHSEPIGYDAFVVPAMLPEAWVAERRNEPGAAEDAYRRALELAGRIGFVDHISFALVRLGSNALAREDTGQAEEPCRRALAMAEAARRRASPRMRVQLARVLEAAGDADTTETLYRSVVEWSQTPRPCQVRELLFFVLAGSPGAAALRSLARLAAALGGRRRGRRPAGPRRRRDRGARPRLARRAARGDCDDLSDAEAAAARGRAVTRGTATHPGGTPNPCGVATAQQPGACWGCRGSASWGHGSRMAAALASVAGKRRLADRTGGDLW
jgi:hypothetical protein